MRISFNPAMTKSQVIPIKQAFKGSPVVPDGSDTQIRSTVESASRYINQAGDLIKALMSAPSDSKDPFAISNAITAGLIGPIEELNQAAKSDPLSKLLGTEAAKRVKGEYKWPEIKDINAWMVSAETQTFMKVGGLAEVAVQLPDSFNKRYAGDENNGMTIVTPLYVGAPEEGKKGKKASIEELPDGKYLYKGAEGKEIELTKIKSVTTKVYNSDKGKFDSEKVDVLTGTFNGTKYIFLRNDKYFGITPHKDNNPACAGGYVYNENGISEYERMPFFCKVAYDLEKQTLNDETNEIKTPNVIIANDWHASAMTTMMRYSAPVEAARGKLSQENFDRIKNTPVIHIIHNNEFDGSTNDNADGIFRTLLGPDCDDINARIKGYNKGGEGFPLASGVGNYTEFLSDLNLADVNVVVSPNHAEELCTASMGNGYEKLYSLRREHGTMLGIVNGYTKSMAEPNAGLVKTVNDKLQLAPELQFVPYSGMYNAEGYEIKMQNKTKMVDILNNLAVETVKGEDRDKKYGFTLYDAENCEIPKDVDIRTIPFIASVGRFVEQKGFDYMAASLTSILSNLKPGQEKPIVAILGSDGPAYLEQLKKLKDTIAQKDPEAAKRIFIFDGFSPGLRDGLGVASDFFLIPSKWEPCGLTQMEAMPKGSLPIATSTGGLADTIVDGKDGFLTDVFYSHRTNEKLFDNGLAGTRDPKKPSIPANNVAAFSVALDRALSTFYKNPDKIQEMAINAMRKDFSWDIPGGSLDEYINLMQTGKLL